MHPEKLKYGIGVVADYSETCMLSGTWNPDRANIEIQNAHVGSSDDLPVWARQWLHERAKQQDDVLFAHLRSLQQEATVIVIDSSCTAPVQLVIQETKNTTNHIVIYVAPQVEAVVVEQIATQATLGVIVDVVVAANASLQYIVDGSRDARGISLIQRNATVRRDATLTWVDVQLSHKKSRSSIHSFLDEPGASAYTYGAFFGNQSQLFDIHNTTVHRASQTRAMMETRGVLTDSARAIYRSLIDIKKGSYHCDGQQTEATLLLSDRAKVSSVPDLAIGNADVQCSHGVSTTNIKAADLFYLASRGVDADTATQVIVEGHLATIVDRIPQEKVKTQIYDALLQKLNT